MKSAGRHRCRCSIATHVMAAVIGLVLVQISSGARATDGIYADLGLGVGGIHDLDDSDGFTSEFWPGPILFGAVGYKWGVLRVETELLYAIFLLDDQTSAGGDRPSPPPPCFLCATNDVSGGISALSLMANAYLEFDVRDDLRVYFGGGVGWARVNANYNFDVTVLGLPTDEEIDFIDDSDSVLAYQGKIGVGFDLSERSELYVGYRYFATQDLSFNIEGGGQLQQDGLNAHIGEIGYRYHF